MAFIFAGITAFAIEPAESQHWAYRPIRPQPLPSVRNTNWVASPVDRFVLSRLEASQLPPNTDADAATLCRRIHFDLTGLPPTPEALDAFVGDSRPDALARLVDSLLASPRFGEHLARHWLDLARFAESVTLRGFLFKEAWRYRDYVMDAFNRDLPIDAFFREQLAGDLLPADTLETQQRQLTATTFLMLGNTNLEEQDKRQMEMDVVDEQLDVIGKALLGQTVACARCHDHKFDPIPTRDYYALAGILKNSLALKHDNVSAWVEQPLPQTPEREAVLRQHESAIADLRARIQTLKKQITSPAASPPDDSASTLRTLEAHLKDALAAAPVRPMVMAPREAANAVDIPIHRRGSVHALGESVPRGFLSVASHPSDALPGPGQSGRTELAHWITSPDNPLTARVFVNRVWLWLMGEGLVRTPDNFGTTGSPPTHPELLDWMAAQFAGVADTTGTPGDRDAPMFPPWSLKSLVRTLVLSRTYRLDSAPSERSRSIDPENRLLSHAHRRRLTAEELRDAILMVSGQLKLDPPRGPTFPADRSADYDFVATETFRSIFIPVFRNALPEVFNVFDFPPTSLATGRRSESIVPTQALFLLNDPFLRDQAEAARNRILAAPADAPRTRIEAAYRLALGRPPSDRESRILLNHLAGVDDPALAWTEVMHALFASADFRLLN